MQGMPLQSLVTRHLACACPLGAHTTSAPLTVALRSRSGGPLGELAAVPAFLSCSSVGQLLWELGKCIN